MNNCPDCGATWKHHSGTEETLVGYCSPAGHNHDDNCRTRTYTCNNGHKHRLHLRNKCSVEGCDWIGKDSCFCHKGQKILAWPDAPLASREVAMRDFLEKQ